MTQTTAPRRRGIRQGKLLPEDTRRHNRALVLQCLFDREQLSRADLARATGLTRVTVSDLVAELIEEGLVSEAGLRADARPGKPATLLSFEADAYHVVGLDLSGHASFRGAVLDLRGRVLHQEERPLGGDPLTLAGDLARSLVGRATRPLLGVGVGSPGIVTPAGVVLTAPNLGWQGLDLARELRAALDVDVHVGNDANVGVLAEHSLGDAAGDLMLVRIGHGVGAGVLLDGRPQYGSHYAAGEIGHVVVGTDGGRPCVCGKEGCLETWLSAPNLVAQAAEQGDRAAVLAEAGRRLGVALAPVVGALDLAEIVLSGPADLLEGVLVETTVETLRARTMTDFHGHLTVRMSGLGEDIVIQGAAAMVVLARLGVRVGGAGLSVPITVGTCVQITERNGNTT